MTMAYLMAFVRADGRINNVAICSSRDQKQRENGVWVRLYSAEGRDFHEAQARVLQWCRGEGRQHVAWALPELERRAVTPRYLP